MITLIETKRTMTDVYLLNNHVKTDIKTKTEAKEIG